MKRGPKVRIDPAKLVAYLDECSEYSSDGRPTRVRHYINDIPVTPNDARMIRRWRAGTIQGVTESAALALLNRYNFDINPRSF